MGFMSVTQQSESLSKISTQSKVPAMSVAPGSVIGRGGKKMTWDDGASVLVYRSGCLSIQKAFLLRLYFRKHSGQGKFRSVSLVVTLVDAVQFQTLAIHLIQHVSIIETFSIYGTFKLLIFMVAGSFYL